MKETVPHVHSFIRSVVQSFVNLFIHSRTRSFVPSFYKVLLNASCVPDSVLTMNVTKTRSLASEAFYTVDGCVKNLIAYHKISTDSPNQQINNK